MNVPVLTAAALTGVPVLETERLVLRAPGPGDAETYIAAHVEERARWIGGNQGRQKAWRTFAMIMGHWALRGFGMWAVAEKSSGRFLGTVGCWYPEGWPEREIVWFLFPEAEGKGIAREAALAARAHAFRVLGWPTAVSYVHPENERSLRLAERLGAVRDDAAPRLMPELGTIVFRHPAPEGPE